MNRFFIEFSYGIGQVWSDKVFGSDRGHNLDAELFMDSLFVIVISKLS